MGLYAVKLLYKDIVTGMPVESKIDEFYNEITEFFEEQILLVKANSFDEAYEKAENESKAYEDFYTNKYGQMVEHKFFDFVDCFHLFDEITDVTEVYSCCFKGDTDIAKRYEQAGADDMHKLRNIAFN